MPTPVAWVTGSAGFIGRALCLELLEQNWRVIAIDNLSSESAKEGLGTIQLLSKHKHFVFIEGDINNVKTLTTLAQPHQVFHLAAVPGVRTSTDLNHYLKANQHSTQQLIQTCKQRQIPALIFASSSSVYGQSQMLPLAETHVCSPHSVYGQSKRYCEQDLAAAANPHFKVIALRLFSVYGPGQRPDMAFRQWSEAFIKGEPINLHHNNTRPLKRDFTFIKDAVQGFIKASQHLSTSTKPYQCFNIGSGESVDIHHAARLLYRLYTQLQSPSHEPSHEPLHGQHPADTPELIQKKAHPAEVFSTHADLTQARHILGYNPRYNLMQGLTYYLESL